MRFENLYLRATGTCLPRRLTVVEAHRLGLCDLAEVRSSQLISVCVSDEESAPRMAVRAADAAVAASASGPGDIGLMLHACAYFQGHDMWPAASYIQDHAVGNRCPVAEINQMSNGGMVALELAATYLVAHPTAVAALVTTGDRFCLPGFDRWRTDRGTICGDGATAAVLSTVDGPVRVHSIVTVSDSGLELLARGDDPAAEAPLTRTPVDLNGCRSAAVERLGLKVISERMHAGLSEAIDTALREAEVKFADITCFVVPALGRRRLRASIFDPFGIDPDQTSWGFGRTTGHLGAGDQMAGLDHFLRTDRLDRGDHCLLIGQGAGFTWSAAVVSSR